MTEYRPSPEYDSQRDEALHYLCRAGWANASSGSVHAPTGWFARISNTQPELPELLDVLEGAVQLEPDQLLGHFLVMAKGDGHVGVAGYADARELQQIYDAMEAQYQGWVGEQS